MSIIGSLPNNIQNGRKIDAIPVMGNFNYIVNQVNSNAISLPILAASSGASLIGYQPVGGVATTVQSKLRQVLSVFDFGAAGDGVADDTAAILAAVTAANNLGGADVIFPPGIYLYSSLSFISPYNGTVLVGAGKFASIIKFTTATPQGFYCWGIGSGIRSLGFTSSVTITGGTYVQLAGVNNFMTDFSMANDMLGIDLTGIAANITDFVFNTGAALSTRIKINCGDGSPNIANGIFMAQSSPTPTSAIALVDVTAITMSNINCLQQGANLSVIPGDGQGVSSCEIINCFFDSGAYGIFIEPTGTGCIARMNFVNCWAGDSSSSGILINNTGTGTIEGINLINCQAPLCTDAGVATAGIVEDINIQGGLYAGSTYGIYLGHTGSAKVMGTNCGAYEGVVGNSTYGISLQPGLTSIICSGNSLLGNTTASIQDSTGNNIPKFINNNIITGYAKSGSISVTGSPFTYTAPYDQTVYIRGGTVSNVSVGGTTIFTTTGGTISLRQGESVVVTYSVAPTMVYTA